MEDLPEARAALKALTPAGIPVAPVVDDPTPIAPFKARIEVLTDAEPMPREAPALEHRPVVTAEAVVPVRAKPDAVAVPDTFRSSRVISIFSGAERRGVWWPSRNITVVSVFGGSDLDFREVDLPPGMTEIRCVSVFGGTDITVPPGLFVKVDGVGLLGAFERDGPQAPIPRDDQPWIRVTGAAVFGGVTIRTAEPEDPDPAAGPRRLLPPKPWRHGRRRRR